MMKDLLLPLVWAFFYLLFLFIGPVMIYSFQHYLLKEIGHYLYLLVLVKLEGFAFFCSNSVFVKQSSLTLCTLYVVRA